jgi:isoleucyl-tRNA synthetase
MEVVVVHQSQAVLDDIKSLDAYVKEEVNVRNVRYTTERGKFFGAVAKPNKRALGHRLGPKASAVMTAVSALTNEQVTTLQKNGSIEVRGDGFTETIKLEEVEIELQFTGDKTVLEVDIA